MNAKEAIEKIKLLFAEVPPVAPVAPVAPVELADPMTVACQACIDAGVPEPCLSTCQACVTDMSEANKLACIEACKTLVSDPSFGELCKACITALGGDAQMADAPAEDVSQFKAEFAQFKTDFESHKQAFTQMSQDFNQAKETISLQQTALAGLVGVVETLSKVEVAQPVQEPVAFEKMTPLQRFRAIK